VILTLLLQTIVIVAAARVVGVAFRRLGQPPVIGEMVAGLLLGPSLLGAAAPAFSAWLFAPETLDLLNAFSQFGLVLFMLLVGLHLDSSMLRANSRLVMATSYTSMLLPFALGVALALPLAGQFGIAGAARLPFMLFVGLSLSITAFPVLVRIVGAHHLTGHRRAFSTRGHTIPLLRAPALARQCPGNAQRRLTPARPLRQRRSWLHHAGGRTGCHRAR